MCWTRMPHKSTKAAAVVGKERNASCGVMAERTFEQWLQQKAGITVELAQPGVNRRGVFVFREASTLPGEDEQPREPPMPPRRALSGWEMEDSELWPPPLSERPPPKPKSMITPTPSMRPSTPLDKAPDLRPSENYDDPLRSWARPPWPWTTDPRSTALQRRLAANPLSQWSERPLSARPPLPSSVMPIHSPRAAYKMEDDPPMGAGPPLLTCSPASPRVISDLAAREGPSRFGLRAVRRRPAAPAQLVSVGGHLVSTVSPAEELARDGLTGGPPPSMSVSQVAPRASAPRVSAKLPPSPTRRARSAARTGLQRVVDNSAEETRVWGCPAACVG